ncbi:hypothetical protein Scel_45290 [Streptomyces cellostaticus]|nr:hypothetical protein Scel_45290 [Streptomyces cellostaticus]
MKESRQPEEPDPMTALSVRQEHDDQHESTGPLLRSRYRLEHVLVASGLALLPWLIVLANGLPGTATAANWCNAWIGLDSLEALGLITTGLLAVRGHHLHAFTATATATLLVVDAWFDTMTAAPGGDRLSAVAMAFGAELPLAVVCVVLAAKGRPRPTA